MRITSLSYTSTTGRLEIKGQYFYPHILGSQIKQRVSINMCRKIFSKKAIGS